MTKRHTANNLAGHARTNLHDLTGDVGLRVSVTVTEYSGIEVGHHPPGRFTVTLGGDGSHAVTVLHLSHATLTRLRNTLTAALYAVDGATDELDDVRDEDERCLKGLTR